MRVHWTNRAPRRQAIRDHIAENNPAAAQREVDKILRRSVRLEAPPDTGHVLQGYEAIPLREVLVRPYRLIYRVQGEQIDIITVLVFV